MTISLKHNKVATTPDDGTSEVGTDEWNHEHDLTQTAAGFIGATAAGASGLLTPADSRLLLSPYTPPLSANFTAFGTGLTVSDKVGRMALGVTSDTVLRGISQALPSAPYTIDAKLQVVGLPINVNATVCGLFLKDAAGKIRGFYVGSWGATANSANICFAIDSWTNSATYSGTPYRPALYMFGGAYHPRITDDGTTRKFYLSTNGLDFDLVYSEASNTFVTPTQCGIVVFNASPNSAPMVAVAEHWLVSNSVLGDAS